MSETPTDPTPTPTPGDPAPAPTPDPANPTPDPAPEPTPDPTNEPDPRVKRANEQAAAERIKRREVEQQLAAQGETLAKLAAVFNPQADPSADPAQQAAQATAQAEQLTNRVSELQAELLVHNIAGEHGGNAVALLDSRTFTTKLHGLDPSADNYSEQVAEAIKAAVTSNATLAAAGQVPSRGGAPGAGQGPADPGGVTQEQFNAMTIGQRNELFQTNPDTYRRLAGSIR